MYIRTTLVVIALTFAPTAIAGWWTPSAIKRLCNRLFTIATPLPKRAISQISRQEYNAFSLARTNALLLYEPNRWIQVGGQGQADITSWLDSSARLTIAHNLDAHLPMWRSDHYWYFQTASEISLYTTNSEAPQTFTAQSYILMYETLAIGEIDFKQATLDLFD